MQRDKDLNYPEANIQITVVDAERDKTISVHPREPIPFLKKKLNKATGGSANAWMDIILTKGNIWCGEQLLNYKSVKDYGISHHDKLQSADDMDGAPWSQQARERLIQIGDRQYMDCHFPTEVNKDDVVTVKDIKKQICEIEKNDRLFDQIILVKRGKKEALADHIGWLRRLEVRMKDTHKWYIEDKFEKLCHGYCDEVKQKTELNISMYIKNIVLTYCPKFNQYSLFHVDTGL